MGIPGTGMGWLLGLGPRGKRVITTLVDGHSVFTFGDRSGKTEYTENMEYVADYWHFYLINSGYFYYPIRGVELGSRFFQIKHRSGFSYIYCDNIGI